MITVRGQSEWEKGRLEKIGCSWENKLWSPKFTYGRPVIELECAYSEELKRVIRNNIEKERHALGRQHPRMQDSLTNRIRAINFLAA
jgi:hypothetical protein